MRYSCEHLLEGGASRPDGRCDIDQRVVCLANHLEICFHDGAAALAEVAAQHAAERLEQLLAVETGTGGERCKAEEDAHERDALHANDQLRSRRMALSELRRIERREAQ